MRDTFALLMIAAIFGVLRFIVPVEGAIAKEDVFKDLAHLFVGFAFGFAAYARNRKELWVIPIALTVLEVVAFVSRKPEIVPINKTPAVQSSQRVELNGCRCGDKCDCTPLDDVCGCRDGPPIIFQRQIESK